MIVVQPQKDQDRIDEMAAAILKKPSAAREFLDYAYGLGFCQGREVTAKEFIAEIDKSSAAPHEQRQEKP